MNARNMKLCILLTYCQTIAYVIRGPVKATMPEFFHFVG